MVPKDMRQVFYLLLALLVLQMFLPEVGAKLESALLAFLDFAATVFTDAQASFA